jgi:inner membrane protein
MNPITHLLVSWSVAESARLERRDRAIVTVAGLVPDVDGAGMIVELATRDTAYPLYWWSQYHHLLGHNVGFAALVAALAWGLARRRWIASALALVTFHLHLLGDLIGARGPDGSQWPIPYLFPFSAEPAWVWSGQWELNAWPNVTLSVLLLALTFCLAWKRGYSPVGLLSRRADAKFVGALRDRFPLPRDLPKAGG